MKTEPPLVPRLSGLPSPLVVPYSQPSEKMSPALSAGPSLPGNTLRSVKPVPSVSIRKTDP